MPFAFDPRQEHGQQGRARYRLRGRAGDLEGSGAVEAPTETGNEPRFVVVGVIGVKHWAAVRTFRGDNVRIISVRRARKEEIRRYESAQDDNGGEARPQIR